MGLLDAPSLRPGDSRPWSIFSGNPSKMTAYTSGKQNAIGDTARVADVAPWDAVAIRLVYVGWQALTGISGEANGYSPCIRVKAAVHRAGASAPDRGLTDPLHQVRFGGREFGTIDARGYIVSDEIPVGIAAGERWWSETYVDCLTGSAPTAPTLTAVTGSGIGVGTHYVAITYVYADGSESQMSAETSVTTSSGTQSVKVTAPAAVPGVIGYRAYIAFSSSANQIKYEQASFPMLPLGVDMTISTSGTTNTLSRSCRTPSLLGWPQGQGLFAGTGEWSVNNRDYTDPPVAQTGIAQVGGLFTPIFVLAVAKDGRLHRSAAALGDSIHLGTGDVGLGAAKGGHAFRALANQTGQVAFDTTKTPKMGFAMLAQGGDSAANDNTPAGGARRRLLAEYATTILDNMGTNDLGAGSAVVYAALKTRIDYWSGRKPYFRVTLDPRGNQSTDGYKTVANQSMTSTDVEADRRAINTSLRATTAAVTVTGEAMFRSPTAGTATPATVFTAGDGTAVKFYTGQPFRTGTETIKVGGTTKTLTTDYTYLKTATIGGITYASGVTMVSAPANGVTVAADYTTAPSLGSLVVATGGQVFDTAAEVEVDASGTKVANGGWWKAGTQVTTGTATASTSSVLTDSSKTWTVDAYRGMAVRITADATTPASVGQVTGILSNTATALTLANVWTTTPSVGATVEVIDSYVIDGVHALSKGAIAKALVIDTTKL